MSYLTIFHKLQEIAQYDVDSWDDGALITLGRSSSTSLPLPQYKALSDHHISVRKLAGDLYIRDEQSTNGSTANGQPMTHALRMHAGVTYQAGPLTIYLEGIAPTVPDPTENADSVFPEPYGFALLPPAEEVYTEEALAQEQPLEVEVSPDPAPYVEKIEAEPIILDSPIAPAPAPIASTPIAATPSHLQPKRHSQSGLPMPFLPIAGIPKTGIPNDFDLKITTPTGSTQITDGDALVLHVLSSEKCKIILICHEEDGSNFILYPNRYETGKDIPAHAWTQLPEENAKHYEFYIEGAGKTDCIQAIARKVDNALMHRVKANGEAPAEEKKEALWAHATLELQVLPKPEPSAK